MFFKVHVLTGAIYHKEKKLTNTPIKTLNKQEKIQWHRDQNFYARLGSCHKNVSHIINFIISCYLLLTCKTWELSFCLGLAKTQARISLKICSLFCKKKHKKKRLLNKILNYNYKKQLWHCNINKNKSIRNLIS